MDSFFAGKRILVTGAGRGIGKGITLRLAELGATVFAMTVSDTSIAGLQNIVGVHPLQVDVSNWEEARKATESVLPIDLLVNNAGICSAGSFLETTEDELDRILRVNLKAVMNISQVVAKSMIERKCHGSIVNLSSIVSQIAWRDHTAYCVSKAAQDSLTRLMALELGDNQIRVNSINPNVIPTDMGNKEGWSEEANAAPLLQRTPLHRFGDVDDVVNSVVFLLSNQSKFITGVNLPLDGGLLIT